MPFTAAEIARIVEGELVGDGGVVLNAFAPANAAKAGELTFAENEAFFSAAEQGDCSAILAPATFTSKQKVLIRVKQPRIAFARVLPLFFPEPKFAACVHPTAVVAATAQIDPTAHIGPHCVVGERVRIGARAVLQGGNHVGADCSIGEDTQLFPNVVVYSRTQIGARVRIHAGSVIGSDGFGYVLDAGAHRKVPQIGNVIIHDDAEIGSNVSIDRGALGSTVIGKGTKIDNLVQIAHNVVIGEHSIICGQAGISGSTKIGNYTVLAGQVGLAGHIQIGNQVTVAAQSGVMHNIPDGEKWFGTPAQPDRTMKRQLLAAQQLPELLRRLKEVEKRLGIGSKTAE
ncbi:MAG: UDP-3-O-(3-hydroxymyristoyl)glucosamine N-acyltransferase [Verrucomicrobia bacterium]|nr:UDP-3-O-(3-hydroxymyristoyl)glucosamine N-acyltransferase [Verrucomicrobiota bacterium]